MDSLARISCGRRSSATFVAFNSLDAPSPFDVGSAHTGGRIVFEVEVPPQLAELPHEGACAVFGSLQATPAAFFPVGRFE